MNDYVTSANQSQLKTTPTCITASGRTLLPIDQLISIKKAAVSRGGGFSQTIVSLPESHFLRRQNWRSNKTKLLFRPNILLKPAESINPNLLVSKPRQCEFLDTTSTVWKTFFPLPSPPSLTVLIKKPPSIHNVQPTSTANCSRFDLPPPILAPESAVDCRRLQRACCVASPISPSAAVSLPVVAPPPTQ